MLKNDPKPSIGALTNAVHTPVKCSNRARGQCACPYTITYESLPLQSGCSFPASWAGSWFQSGVQGLIGINSTHIQAKGECADTEATDKFLVYDR
ncbi:hypothetical protein EVAR_81947_1 [Eumeta japonica]|uniref:DUF7044 domain-containing protein n=1 Tax=Eumeta variegata TaxID=151549 RepID=A0A4C1ZJ53_EUMVA|nr:hypothetical protein EVAR_81947_1 [Eumeta japonica]